MCLAQGHNAVPPVRLDPAQVKHSTTALPIKGKSILPIGSIFFPSKVVPMRKENNFKGHFIEKTPKLNCANMQVI